MAVDCGGGGGVHRFVALGTDTVGGVHRTGLRRPLPVVPGSRVDPRYGWVQVCLEKFGAAPTQMLDEWNTVEVRMPTTTRVHQVGGR